VDCKRFSSSASCVGWVYVRALSLALHLLVPSRQWWGFSALILFRAC